MATRLEKLRDAILANHPKSRLKPMTDAEVKRLRERFPKMPAQLRNFFATVGRGGIGDSRYMIYALMSPSSVMDEQTAARLKGVYLVGDDYAGTHEAYDTRGDKWRFGTVGDTGRFRVCKKPPDFISFLEEWYGRPDAG